MLVSGAPAVAQDATLRTPASPVVLPNATTHQLTAQNGRTYTLYVQLPERYADSDSVTYPVLYVTDAEAELIGMFTGLAYFLRNFGGVRDVILVGVADGDVAQHFRRLRRIDYTPTPRPAGDTLSGGAAAFLAFLRDQAIPFVERHYRAQPDDRGIWGHSLGGLFASYALLQEPATFHRYIISSPTLVWDGGVLLKDASTRLRNGRTLPARIYSAFGAEESPAEIQAWNAFFAEFRASPTAGARVTAELVPEADHLTVMPIAFVRGLNALYRPQPIAQQLDAVITASGFAEARRVYYHLLATEPGEYDFGETQLNDLGYVLLERSQIADAIEVFRLNVERFPRSSNAYDSLGEAFMTAGDTTQAITNYRRALELDPTNANAAAMLRKLGGERVAPAEHTAGSIRMLS